MKSFIRILSVVLALVLTISLCACKENKNEIEDQTEPEAKADVRIMSYNILNPEWSSTGETAESRVEPFFNLVKKYMPDVIGLQEASYLWHNVINNALQEDDTYQFACEKNNVFKENMTTFLYNTKTVRLVDESFFDLEKNSDHRVLAIAIFEKISDGKQFIVTNVHPAPSSREEEYPRQMSKFTEYAQYILEIYKDKPIMMTGDFNTSEQSEYYTNFLKDTGVKDAKYEAETLIRNYNTFAGFNKKASDNGKSCIDHIFVNDKVTVKTYDVIVDDGVEKISDHVPICADIIFK